MTENHVRVAGHWQNPKLAHGDKRNPEDFARWRKLADIGRQTDRHMLAEQATVLKVFRGRAELDEFDAQAPTI